MSVLPPQALESDRTMATRHVAGRIALSAFGVLGGFALARAIMAGDVESAEQRLPVHAAAGNPAAGDTPTGHVSAGHSAYPLALPSQGVAEAALTVVVRLDGRRAHNTPLIVALEREGQPLVPLVGHADAAGVAGPLRLPPGTEGVFDVMVRVPGFLGARALGVELGGGETVIDFGGGGLTPLRAGDLSGDGRITATDVGAWWKASRLGLPEADLNGDGGAGPRDLWVIWRNRGLDGPGH